MIENETRRFHSDSRLSENFTKKGLVSLTGQDASMWLRYIVKELIDNSLEACSNPEIGVIVDGNKLSIKDNGSGVSEKNIYNIFKDIRSFGGCKRHYKTPTRGVQGNALMTLLGIQNLMGYPLLVTSNDKQYRVSVARNDITDEYTVNIEKNQVKSINGLEITLRGDLSHFVQGWNATVGGEVYKTISLFGELNPQASFIYREDDKEMLNLKRQENVDVKTLSLGGSTSGKITWFSYNDFIERLKADFRAAPDLKISDFIGEFLGISSYRKRREVLEHAQLEGVQYIKDFFTGSTMDTGMAHDLYYAMKKETKSFSVRNLSTTLGSIGEKGMYHTLDNSLDLSVVGNDARTLRQEIDGMIRKLKEKEGIEISRKDLFTYYSGGAVIKNDEKTMPFYFEMVSVPFSMEHDTLLRFGINQSFLYSNPRDMRLSINTGSKEKRYWSFEGAFSDLNYSFKVICNLICPNIDFQDRGKHIFNIKPFEKVFTEVLGLTVRKLKRDILPVLNKLIEKEEPQRPSSLGGKADKSFIKDFVFDNFDSVYNKATGNGKYIITLRQLFYAMRPVFNKKAERYGYKYTWDSTVYRPKKLELKYETFARIVNEYECEVLRKRVIYKDRRGFFVEPHSDKRVDLGTLSVERYSPDNAIKREFNNLLFLEKTGFYELIHNDFKISRRYDLGIINCKGYGNNAARNLIGKIKERRPEIRLFILTDFDIAGMGIAEDITKPDELSSSDVFKECYRIGVTVEDIERYDLEGEQVHLTSADKTQLENMLRDGVVTIREYEFLKAGQRVEINAFTPVRLKEYLEDKLKEFDVKKLQPEKEDLDYLPEENIDLLREKAKREAIGGYVIEKTQKKLLDFINKRLADEDFGKAEEDLEELYDEDSLYKEVINELKKLPIEGWPEINEKKLEDRRGKQDEIIGKFKKGVKDAVRSSLSDVGVSLDFTNCTSCDDKPRDQAPNQKIAKRADRSNKKGENMNKKS